MGWKWRLFSFRGRFSRGAYWAVTLANLAFMLAVVMVFAAVGTVAPDPSVTTVLTVLFVIGIFVQVWIILAAMVKRLHDRDRSGWWILIFGAVPSALEGIGQAAGRAGGDGALAASLVFSLAGSAISIWALIEFGFLRGTIGDNRFGPDPVPSAVPPGAVPPPVPPSAPPSAPRSPPAAPSHPPAPSPVRRHDPWKR